MLFVSEQPTGGSNCVNFPKNLSRMRMGMPGFDLHRETMSLRAKSGVRLGHGANVYRLPLNADDNVEIIGRQGEIETGRWQ